MKAVRAIEIVQVRLGDHHIVRARGLAFLPSKPEGFEKAQGRAEKLKNRLERLGINCDIVCILMPQVEQEVHKALQTAEGNALR